MNERKAACIERCTCSLVGGQWKRALAVPRQWPTQLDNRKRPRGWLAPSLRSKAESTVRAIVRVAAILPVKHVRVEVASFDTQQMQAPEISGIEYQQGELAG